MKSILLLALLAIAPTPVAAKCARVELGPTVLTRRDTKLPADGGVLVGYAWAQDGETDPETTWTAGKVTLARTELAPGLSVLRANAPTFKLATKSGKDRGSYTRDPKSAAVAMAAPSPKAISEQTSKGARWTTTTTKLALSTAPPADAVAIIAYDANKKPLLYATLPDTHDKLLELEIDRSGGHCGSPKPDGQGSLTGKITFAYVDVFGRLSPTSTAITAQ